MSRSDIPFAANDAHTFLPWVIGIMVCLATLLLCLGLTLNGWIIDRHDAYTGNFTVNIPATADDLPAKTAKIHDLLQKLPGVSAIIQTSDANLRTMLKPWLGNSAAVAALPLPVVLDVTATPSAALDYDDVQKRLSAIAPGTELDTHEGWITSFSDFTAAMQWLLGALAALIAGGLALMIAFTSRASLRLHAKTVHLLHSIGAEDIYITRQFQREAFWLMLRGTVPGAIIAGLVYWGAGVYLASLQASALPSLILTMTHAALLLAVPLACGGVAWMTARISVIRQLRHVL